MSGRSLVILPPEIAEKGAREATRDEARAKGNQWAHANYQGPDRLGIRIRSYQAEEAVAQWFGVELVRDLDGFKAPDVLGYSVRYGNGPRYGLVLHDRDGEYPYILVVPGPTERSFEIVGWMSRDKALALRARGVGRPLPGSTDPWLIPQSYMDSL
jgi:hypothetical protein